MESLRRLGVKERPALFSKGFAGQQDSSTSLTKDQKRSELEPLSSMPQRLPDIEIEGMQSFSDLFDGLAAFEVSDSSPELLKDIPIPKNQVSSTHTTSSRNIQQSIVEWSSIPKSPHQRITDIVAMESPVSDVASSEFRRNYSYESSEPSQPTDSDVSPEISRNSSTSSVTPAASPTICQGKTRIARKPVSGLNFKALQSMPTSPTRDWLSPKVNRSSTTPIPRPPDLNKPLPKGPVGYYDYRPNPPQKDVEPTFNRHKTHHPSSHTRSTSLSLPLERLLQQQTKVSELSSGTLKLRRGKKTKNSTTDNDKISKSPTHIEKAESLYSKKSKIDLAPSLALENIRNRGFESASAIDNVDKRYSSITTRTAQDVIYKIMSELDNVKDLQSAAMISKGFQVTFRRHESKLVSNLMYKISRPAWEYRNSVLRSKGQKMFRLKDFQHDISTIDALESLVLMHCGATCRYDTIPALIGVDSTRKAEIDNALWRIWTFCTLFGSNSDQTSGLQSQLDWLRGKPRENVGRTNAGFGIGNGEGLSISELEDMSEMWECLQILLSGYEGREIEAQKYGVFSNLETHQNMSKQECLSEWISYMSALGLQTVLSVSTCSFEAAKSLGLMKWSLPSPGQSWTTFLIKAIGQSYQDRLLAEAIEKAGQTEIPRRSSRRPNKSVDESELSAYQSRSSKALVQQALRINTSNLQRKPVPNLLSQAISTPTTAPVIQNRPDCDLSGDASVSRTFFPASPTNDPSMLSSLNMTSAASTRFGATLFPLHYTSPLPQVPFSADQVATVIPPVIDPADKAMDLLVRELGFSEMSSRRALALSDNGSGLDIPRAIEILMVESRADAKSKSFAVELPGSPAVASPMKSLATISPRNHCEGECRRKPTILAHSRNKSTENRRIPSSVYTASPVSPTSDEEMNDDVPPLPSQPNILTQKLNNTSRTGMINRMTIGKGKIWKSISSDGKSPISWDKINRKHSDILDIDEYQAKVERSRSQRLIALAESNLSASVESAGINNKITAVSNEPSSNDASHPVKAAISRNLVDIGLGLGGFIQMDKGRRSPKELE